MNILMVLTSHERLGNTGKKTGFWLEEFASPFYVFKDAGARVTLASPLGGQPPVDPSSAAPASQTEATRRFAADQAANEALAHTSKLSDVSIEDFDGVFYPGGHGPLWDLANDAASIRLIETAFAGGKPVAAVCHAPGVLRLVKRTGRRPDGRGSVSRRGHVAHQRRRLFQGRGLAAPRRHRWASDHRAEPRVVGIGGEGFAGGARAVAAPLISAAVLRSVSELDEIGGPLVR